MKLGGAVLAAKLEILGTSVTHAAPSLCARHSGTTLKLTTAAFSADKSATEKRT